MVILIKKKSRMKLAHPMKGILFAAGGTLGQAAGLVLSKHGLEGYDAFAATQIRIIAAIAAFALIVPIAGLTGSIKAALNNSRAMGLTSLGAFFGPFLCVSLSLVAVSLIEVGVASTIMAMVPVFIIFPEVLFMGKRLRSLEVAGAVVAVAGVALVSL